MKHKGEERWESQSPELLRVVVRGVVVSSRHHGRFGPLRPRPPKPRHVAWRKHCSAIGLPGSTVAVDKSAVGRRIRRAPMQPKSIGLR